MESAQAALAALPLDTGPLAEVLSNMAADSWIAGKLAALDQLNSAVLSKSALRKADEDTTPVKWNLWTPGDINAGNVVVHGGLADLLGSQQLAIQGITGSALDALGNVIGVALIAGDPVDRLAGNLGKYGYVTPDRADRIAHTETARAVTAATFDTYQINGVDEWNLVLSDGACQECVDAQEAGPYAPWDTENSPPVHPYCRCAAAPVIKDLRAVAAGEDLAIGLGVEEATSEAEGDDGLIRQLWSNLEGYLNPDVLGDYTTDLQGRELAVALGREAPDAADAVDLTFATEQELATAIAESPSADSSLGEDATEALFEELDTRDENAATYAANTAALGWDGTGAPPVNPYAAGSDLAQLWQLVFNAARAHPTTARAAVAEYDTNNLED